MFIDQMLFLSPKYWRDTPATLLQHEFYYVKHRVNIIKYVSLKYVTVPEYSMQWLKWFCEAGGGSPDEARLEQTPYPFQPH